MLFQKITVQTRWYRKVHKWTAISLLIVMFLMGATGLLLTWKNEWQLMPPSAQSKLPENTPAISLDSIQEVAVFFVKDSLLLPTEINRIDVRPRKGIAKVRFEDHFTEVQVDIKSGEILSVKTRTADIIEKIHDGSILDFLFKTEYDQYKLIYATISSIGLIVLSLSGFFLWYNPIRLRKLKRQRH